MIEKKTRKRYRKKADTLALYAVDTIFLLLFLARSSYDLFASLLRHTHHESAHFTRIDLCRTIRTHTHFFFFFATIKYRTIVCLVALDKNIYMLRLFRLFGCWGEIRQPCVTHRKKPKKREIEKQPNERYACVYVVVIVVIWICAMSIYIVLSLRRLIATDWISVPSRMYTAANEHNTTHTSQQQYQYVALQKALLLMLLLSLLL